MVKFDFGLSLPHCSALYTVPQAVSAACQCCLYHLPLLISPTLSSKGKTLSSKGKTCKKLSRSLLPKEMPVTPNLLYPTYQA